MITQEIIKRIQEDPTCIFLKDSSEITKLILKSSDDEDLKLIYLELLVQKKISSLIFAALPFIKSNARDLIGMLTAYAIQESNVQETKIHSIVGNLVTAIYNELYPDVCVDHEGNIYKTIRIGNQVWMAENLRTVKDNNGETFGFFRDDSEAARVLYGAFYSQRVIKTDIAPKGWRLPEVSDFKELEQYLRSEYPNVKNVWKLIASDKMWCNSENQDTIGNDLSKNNITGFNLLPAGYNNTVGNFNYVNETVGLRTKTEYYNKSFVYCFYSAYESKLETPTPNYSYNIRCIKK